MNKPEIIDVIDDRLSRRFEAYAQAQIKVHKDYHDKMVEAVESQIKVTVNGKIDKIQVSINEVKEDVKILREESTPAIKTTSFAKSFAKVVLYLCGAVVSIGGAIMVISKLTTK
jgi:hypothetical protein